MKSRWILSWNVAAFSCVKPRSNVESHWFLPLLVVFFLFVVYFRGKPRNPLGKNRLNLRGKSLEPAMESRWSFLLKVFFFIVGYSRGKPINPCGKKAIGLSSGQSLDLPVVNRWFFRRKSLPLLVESRLLFFSIVESLDPVVNYHWTLLWKPLKYPVKIVTPSRWE